MGGWWRRHWLLWERTRGEPAELQVKPAQQWNECHKSAEAQMETLGHSLATLNGTGSATFGVNSHHLLLHLNPLLYPPPHPLSPPASTSSPAHVSSIISSSGSPQLQVITRSRGLSTCLPRPPYLQYIYPLYISSIYPPVYPVAITALLDYRPFRQCTQSTPPKMPRTLSEAQKSGVSSSAIPYFHLPLQRSSSEAPVWRPPPPTDLVSNALSTLCIALLPFQCFKDSNLTVPI